MDVTLGSEHGRLSCETFHRKLKVRGRRGKDQSGSDEQGPGKKQ